MSWSFLLNVHITILVCPFNFRKSLNATLCKVPSVNIASKHLLASFHIKSNKFFKLFRHICTSFRWCTDWLKAAHWNVLTIHYVHPASCSFLWKPVSCRKPDWSQLQHNFLFIFFFIRTREGNLGKCCQGNGKLKWILPLGLF